MLRRVHTSVPDQLDLTDEKPPSVEVDKDEDKDEDVGEDEHEGESELEEEEDEITGDEDENELADGREYDDFQSQIWKSLLKLQRPSVFVTAESRSVAANPGLHIAGHGTVGFPLSAHDARSIIARSKPALLGNEQPNFSDDSPCKIWELGASEMLITNPEWSNEIQRSISKTYKEFGLYHGRENISAKLSKLRLYESGPKDASIVNAARPSEVFGTLIVCLPSLHQGGKLVFRHDHETYEFDTQENSSFNTSLAAIYADVAYEMTPITSGYCLMLFYDLILGPTLKVDLRAPAVSNHKTRLLTLLETYNQRLEDGAQLAPILLHNFDGVYGKDNLTWDTLVPKDCAVVSALNEVGRESGFHLYLATLEMEVTKSRYEDEDEWEDSDDGDDHEDGRSQTVEHLLEVVELDGRRIAKKMVIPDANVVLEPHRRKRGEAYAYSTEHNRTAEGEDWNSCTLNETVFTYRDTVVVIVPPSRSVDFICEFGHDRNKTKKKMQELRAMTAHTDSRRSQLSRICNIVLDGRYIPSESPLFLEAAEVALEVDEYELFHIACKKTSGKASLTHSRALGQSIARFGGIGPVRMEYSIIGGLRCAADRSASQRFLDEIEEGFKIEDPPSDEMDVPGLREYCNDMLLEVEFGQDELRKSECSALAQLKQKVNWGNYERHARPKLLASTVPVRIAFLNAFTSPEDALTDGQREFAALIIDSVWASFAFVAVETPKPPAETTSYYHGYYNRNAVPSKVSVMLTSDDLAGFISLSLSLVPNFDLNNHIIPRLLTAVFKASAAVSFNTFLPFIKAMLELKYPIFNTIPPSHSVPEPHKILVETMLGRYIWTNVGEKPVEPKNWKLPIPDKCHKYYSGYTTCDDCRVINNFLLDTKARQYDLTCGVQRQRHLSEQYSKGSYDTCTIRLKNGRNLNPDTWRITKNESGYRAEMQKWSTNVSKAKMHLERLAATEVERARLRAYLDPHYDLFMAAETEQLPMVDTQLPFEREETTNAESGILDTGDGSAANIRKRKQRGDSESSVEILGSNKKGKSEADKENISGTDEDFDTDEVSDTDEVKIVDLTDM